MNILEKIINKHNIAKINRIISKSEEFTAAVSKLSDEEIKDGFQSCRSLSSDKETRALPFSLALVVEVFKRVQNVSPYREQLICAVALFSGYIPEMKTGEGKSIAAVIAAILCSLHGKVHIVTVNDYLAKRDYEKMKLIYKMLGLSCGANQREHPNKSELYESDIIYTSSMELIFDYLRNQISSNNEKIHIPLDAVIIDEIDFVLLDNANSTFSISIGENQQPPIEVFKLAKEICSFLKGEERSKDDFLENTPDTEGVHYTYFPHNRTAYLTDNGLNLIENLFGIRNLMTQNLKLYRAIIYTLEANLFYISGRDYIVSDRKVILINRENGRLMPSSQHEADLHTAIEVKEGVDVSHRHFLTNSLSYQVFFTQYKHMVGMSGTICEAKDEFEGLYHTPTMIIPLHRPNLRVDYPDIFFRTMKEKYNFLIDYVMKKRPNGQPILIIAGSESEAEKIYELVKAHHKKTTNLLNARSAEEEELLVKSAGIHDTITISTNIAGRGTDIVLDPKAKGAGGLMVLVLKHYESERIDNQVRGRAGRQGDNGGCLFLVSLEDDIWTHLDEHKSNKVEKIISNWEFPLHPKVSKELQKVTKQTQKALQSANFNTRQMIFILGDIVEKQRILVYNWEKELKQVSIVELTRKYIHSKEFDLGLFKEMWRDRASDITIDFEQLEQLTADKCSDLGDETAKVLSETLLSKIIEIEWLQFKYDMEYVKSYLPLYRLNEEQTVRKYIEIFDEQYRLFRQNVMNNLLGYFLTAKVKEIECA